MRKYRLTRAADHDIADIYVYTHREFGEVQADAYLESLETALIRLGDNPNLGVDVSQLRKGYRRLVHKEHAIYYKTVRSGILIRSWFVFLVQAWQRNGIYAEPGKDGPDSHKFTHFGPLPRIYS